MYQNANGSSGHKSKFAFEKKMVTIFSLQTFWCATVAKMWFSLTLDFQCDFPRTCTAVLNQLDKLVIYFFLFLQEIHYVSGTSRYMSPELLDRYSDLSNPESFKQVDLYALSLVIWEILNRTTLSEMDKAPGKAVY